jgi:hypothetical protein
MATITGKLETFYGEGDVDGIATLDVALCNYGSQVPRSQDAMLADVTIKGLTADETTNAFSFEVDGNDVIEPAGTYYTVTVKDGNGDIIQTNAYIFLDANDYDLGTAQPFDPTLPVPPLPPLIYNQLVTVPYQPNIGLDASTATAFLFPCSGSEGVTIDNAVAGNLYTFIIEMDNVGGHNFYFAANVHNAAQPNQDPNGITVQTFVCDTDGSLYPIGAGTYQ